MSLNDLRKIEGNGWFERIVVMLILAGKVLILAGECK
jgi:hypothetical protein